MTRSHIALIALTASAVLFSGVPVEANEHANPKIAALFSTSASQEAEGKTDGALNDVLRILRLDPKHYIANYRAGWLYYVKGRYGDSVKFYKKAAQLRPKSVEAQLGLLLPLMAAQRWGEAESVARQLLVKSPANYLAGSRLAFILYSSGQYGAASRQYQAVLQMYPSEIEMMLGLGWAYVKQGRQDEARAAFNQVLGISQGNLKARAGLEAL